MYEPPFSRDIITSQTSPVFPAKILYLLPFLEDFFPRPPTGALSHDPTGGLTFPDFTSPDPVYWISDYQLLVFIHKYVHQRTKLLAVFSTYLEENKLVHHYNTRQKEDFHTNVVQSEMGKRAVKYKGSKLWNNLPTELKEIQSLRSFKYKLRSRLLQSLF